MWPISCIEKKRYGNALEKEEIKQLIKDYVNGTIPDYQMAAWLMAVCIQGMTYDETVALTMAMAESGKQVNLQSIEGIKVDKHSTGGIADTVTLICAPLAAAAGVPIAKMSGRGLGFTGGTIDKLESIPGFQTAISEEAFVKQVQEIGIAVIQQTEDIAVADKKLYALRDTTATVASLPLIASSIMSKKIAAGADRIVLDVKYGKGAFMATIEEAEELANTMISIGSRSGRKTAALLSPMDKPLGLGIGNSIEVDEAISVLGNTCHGRLYEAALQVTGLILYMGEVVATIEEGIEKAKRHIEDGSGLAKCKDWIAAQGGDTSWIGRRMLTKNEQEYTLYAPQSGYITDYDGRALGEIVMQMGAGRAKKEDTIDPYAGLWLQKEIGDFIAQDEPLAILYGKAHLPMEKLGEQIQTCIQIHKTKDEKEDVIKKMIL